MNITQTYKEGVVTESCVKTFTTTVSFLKVKPDDGGAEVTFTHHDGTRHVRYPVGTRIKYVLINGNPTGAEGFNY